MSIVRKRRPRATQPSPRAARQLPPEVAGPVATYRALLGLDGVEFAVTTDRAEFGRWLGRPVPSAYGGAYVFLRSRRSHAILINLERIDRTQAKAIEIVVAEELIHLRDHLDGDHRRHAKHGSDRIAHRVATITGASLEEVRGCLLPVNARPLRYRYACPGCGAELWRKRRGTWSCASCAPRFDRRYVFRLIEDVGAER